MWSLLFGGEPRAVGRGDEWEQVQWERGLLVGPKVSERDANYRSGRHDKHASHYWICEDRLLAPEDEYAEEHCQDQEYSEGVHPRALRTLGSRARADLVRR